MKLIYKTYPSTRKDLGIVSWDFEKPMQGARLLRVEIKSSDVADHPFIFWTIWIVGEDA